ncbi:MAG: hypothetical protein AAF902_22020, partial [Chloroflexota bacterium]
MKQKNSLRRKKGGARKNRPPRPKPSPARTRTQPASSVSSELQSAVQLLQTKETGVQQRAQLSSIQSEISRIDGAFVDIPLKISDINKRGFVFTKDMDDALALVEDEWLSGLQDAVDDEFDGGLRKLSNSARSLDRAMDQLVRPNKLMVDKAESQLEQLESLISTTEQSIRGRYSAILLTVNEIYDDLDEADTALNLLNDSEIELRGSEAVVMVGEAEWEIDGEDEGPDGYLYLTDQRLLFEQKEEVAEKKFLFITTKSTEVQKLLMDVELRNIDTIEHSEEKRRRLQWGADEILSMTLAGQADLSRLRFHIKNQEAEDWKETLKYVLSGQIQEDRFDFDEAAEAVKLIFPATCPSCMAAIPPQPGGV